MANKNEIPASEDASGDTKYTVRADRSYRAECRSKGARPMATIEWYLLKNNLRYEVGRSKNGSSGASYTLTPAVQSGEKHVGLTTILEGTVGSIVETQQVSANYS